MSFGASTDTKQRIKEAIDIVDLVGSYFPLRREGHLFKALCPWHDDTRPSLYVNPDRQSFKCWVCDIGGDIFSFLMKVEGVTFPEALGMLADRAGIRIEAPDGRGPGAAASDEKQVLYQAMAWAAQRYHECLLHGEAAAAARQYFTERSISSESITRFKLGFAPNDWDWILQKAAATAFSVKVLEKIGLVSQRKEREGYYDRFRGRVLFPIVDMQGRGVGLGGRVLPSLAGEGIAKYINSPDTPLFSKSTLLYGLAVAREAIRKTGAALVMEGYTDCVMAHQFGFHNAVAVLGTAIGSQQIRLLRRLADPLRIVLVLDGDEAGKRRANEILALFVAENVDLRVLTLPDGLDPCEFLLQRGPEAFTTLVEDAADALRHAYVTATRGVDLNDDLDAASRALGQLVQTIAKAPRPATGEDHLREEKFLSRLAKDFRVSEEAVRQKMRQLRRKPLASPAQSAAGASGGTNPDKIDACERDLLQILLQVPEAIGQLGKAVQAEQIASLRCRQIFEKCCQLAAAGHTPDFQRLLLEIDDPEVKNLLVELDEQGRQKACGDPILWLQDIVARLAQRQQEPLLRERLATLKERQLAAEDEIAILLETMQQERNRQGISAPTDG